MSILSIQALFLKVKCQSQCKYLAIVELLN
jgi:hypothetical protein